jgi:hypothetical protein
MRTSAPINNKYSAYFNGILMYRFIILTIGFIINSCQDTYARGEHWLNNSYSHTLNMAYCLKSKKECYKQRKSKKEIKREEIRGG